MFFRPQTAIFIRLLPFFISFRSYATIIIRNLIGKCWFSTRPRSLLLLADCWAAVQPITALCLAHMHKCARARWIIFHNIVNTSWRLGWNPEWFWPWLWHDAQSSVAHLDGKPIEDIGSFISHTIETELASFHSDTSQFPGRWTVLIQPVIAG